jgi:hypothetical protein
MKNGGVVMKTYFSLLLVAAGLLFASTAQAQAIRVKADIPFDFVVGNTVYRAGTYTIAATTQTSNALLLDGGNARAIVMPNVCSLSLPSNSTKLVFDRMGSSYFLSQVWVEGRSDGREFPKSKAELQMAKNHTPSESVTVVAQLIH